MVDRSRAVVPRLSATLTVVAVVGVWVASGLGATPLQLKSRVLRTNELSGFKAGNVQQADTIDDWARVAPNALTNLRQRLRREGFIAAIREDLSAGSNDRGALSIVVHLGNRRAAKNDLERQLRDYATEGSRLSGHTYAAFPVKSIPGAHGFVSTDPHGGTGINVIFADGAFTYHVGAGWADGAKSPPTTAAIIRAATHLYARVRAR